MPRAAPRKIEDDLQVRQAKANVPVSSGSPVAKRIQKGLMPSLVVNFNEDLQHPRFSHVLSCAKLRSIPWGSSKVFSVSITGINKETVQWHLIYHRLNWRHQSVNSEAWRKSETSFVATLAKRPNLKEDAGGIIPDFYLSTQKWCKHWPEMFACVATSCDRVHSCQIMLDSEKDAVAR